jgi:hypothetical protein
MYLCPNILMLLNFLKLRNLQLQGDSLQTFAG